MELLINRLWTKDINIQCLNIQSLTTDFGTFVGSVSPAVRVSVTLPGLGVAAAGRVTLDVAFLTVLQGTSLFLI